MENPNGVMMQFFHWYKAPDGTLWNELKEQAGSLKEAGFTALWLPPAYKGNAGGYDVGYSVYDMYDLGEFDQKGSMRTKYGTRDELLAAVKAAKESGLQLYWDLVLNHRMGGDAEEEFTATPCGSDNRHKKLGEPRTIKAYTHFTFPGRKKKYSEMEWHWWHFTATDHDGNHPDSHDVLLFEGKEFASGVDMEKGSFDFLMGCDVDVKHPEVIDETKRWGEWFVDTVELDGVRFDAVKHVEAGFFPDWLSHVRNYAKRRIFAVGEYWSYDIDALHHFISVTNGDVALFDAPLHLNFSEASKSGNDFDMSRIFENTLVKNEPVLAVTIVANHDTQPLQALESVVEEWFKPLAYALILLRRDGYPCVFYADYYGAKYEDVGRDGNTYPIEITCHKKAIDELLGARRTHAFGEQFDYFDHKNTVGWTRMGTEEHPGGLAVVLSNGDTGTKRMQTALPKHAFYDLTGNVVEVIETDKDGWAEFKCAAGSVSVWLPV
ncbi:MAG: alpha-amylase [Armatimonadetes bacterium]|nr:alpha-amylase [Akkermansiaceae bacterium]